MFTQIAPAHWMSAKEITSHDSDGTTKMGVARTVD
jgi:hypothetical protein